MITCQHCGSEYLHHFLTTVYRRREDEPRVRCTTIAGEDIYDQYHEATVCPSSRRDAVSVLLHCEECWKTSRLNITQHKGNTNLEVIALAGEPCEAHWT